MNGKKKSRRQRIEKAPKLTMSILMQSRSSFSSGKDVGVDGISAEILEMLPWRAPHKMKNVFELRYTGQSKVYI